MATGSPNSGAPALLRSGEKVSVRADALTVVRGERVLFEGLSFAVEPGDYVEVRGANGAGKTTLLRTIAGLTKPQSGNVEINDEAPELALHLVGHRDGLKHSADGRAHVRYWAGLLGGDASDVDAALERVGMGALAGLPVRVLSQGQQRRISLARLLVSPRPVWLLDEPAAALDTNGKKLVADLVAEHCAQGGVAIAAVHEALGVTPARTLELTP